MAPRRLSCCFTAIQSVGSGALTAAASVLLGACADDPVPASALAGPRTATSALVATDVPRRGADDKHLKFDDLADTLVFRMAVDEQRPATGPTRASTRAAAGQAGTESPVFYVGVKRPGEARGWWRGQRLVDGVTWQAGVRVLEQLPGVAVLGADSLLPLVRVTVRDADVLGRLRRLPFIDYVTPALVLRDENYAFGCEWEGDGSSYTYHPTYGDRIPESYTRSSVPDAWQLSTGAGVLLGLTDTGVSEGAREFYANFASGWSTNRTFEEFVNEGDASCSHGTRMAGVMAGPMNGVDYAGVAWRSSLFSSRQANSVIVQGTDAFQSIRDAGNRGAGVITMAWGTATYRPYIEDEITRLYYNHML